jgi:drug/metabolite transporter (DMT)-like permease
VEAILRAGEPEEEAMSGDTFFDDHDDDIERLLSVNTHSSNSTGNSTSSRSGGGIGISKGMDAFPPGTKTSMTPMSVSIDDYDYSYASSRAYSSSSGTFDKTWREKTRSRLARAVRAAVEAESGSWMAYAVGWTAMLLAILSSAATTPMFKYLEESGVSPGLAACWRSQAMSVFLVPIAVVEALTTGQHIKAWERRPDLEYQIFVHVGFAGLGWAASLLFYINGLELTTAVRASLITNMHPLIMVLYMCLRGQRVDRLDWGGVLLAFSGIMVMALDKVGSSGVNHRDVHASSSPMLELCGMFLCLAAATADCFVMINRKMIKKYVPLMQYTCVTALFVLVACAIFSMLFEDTEVFCVGRNDCLFGWAGSRWIQPMATFGFVNGVVCQAGFNFAVRIDLDGPS